MKKNIRIAIAKSVQTKADVVSQDEKELGIRAALNYGPYFWTCNWKWNKL